MVLFGKAIDWHLELDIAVVLQKDSGSAIYFLARWKCEYLYPPDASSRGIGTGSALGRSSLLRCILTGASLPLLLKSCNKSCRCRRLPSRGRPTQVTKCLPVLQPPSHSSVDSAPAPTRPMSATHLAHLTSPGSWGGAYRFPSKPPMPIVGSV